MPNPLKTVIDKIKDARLNRDIDEYREAFTLADFLPLNDKKILISEHLLPNWVPIPVAESFVKGVIPHFDKEGRLSILHKLAQNATFFSSEMSEELGDMGVEEITTYLTSLGINARGIFGLLTEIMRSFPTQKKVDLLEALAQKGYTDYNYTEDVLRSLSKDEIGKYLKDLLSLESRFNSLVDVALDKVQSPKEKIELFKSVVDDTWPKHVVNNVLVHIVVLIGDVDERVRVVEEFLDEGIDVVQTLSWVIRDREPRYRIELADAILKRGIDPHPLILSVIEDIDDIYLKVKILKRYLKKGVELKIVVEEVFDQLSLEDQVELLRLGGKSFQYILSNYLESVENISAEDLRKLLGANKYSYLSLNVIYKFHKDPELGGILSEYMGRYQDVFRKELYKNYSGIDVEEVLRDFSKDKKVVPGDYGKYVISVLDDGTVVKEMKNPKKGPAKVVTFPDGSSEVTFVGGKVIHKEVPAKKEKRKPIDRSVEIAYAIKGILEETGFNNIEDLVNFVGEDLAEGVRRFYEKELRGKIDLGVIKEYIEDKEGDISDKFEVGVSDYSGRIQRYISSQTNLVLQLNLREEYLKKMFSEMADEKDEEGVSFREWFYDASFRNLGGNHPVLQFPGRTLGWVRLHELDSKTWLINEIQEDWRKLLRSYRSAKSFKGEVADGEEYTPIRERWAKHIEDNIISEFLDMSMRMVLLAARRNGIRHIFMLPAKVQLHLQGNRLSKAPPLAQRIYEDLPKKFMFRRKNIDLKKEFGVEISGEYPKTDYYWYRIARVVSGSRGMMLQ